MDHPQDRQQDSYRYAPQEIADFDQRVTLEPVAPSAIEARIDAGERLVTADVPEYLDRGLAPDADASVALYRLVQLFGTPNVPGLEAGGDQGDREKTTWHYLFRVVHRPEDGPEAEYLVSVYDYRTELSVGLSEWTDGGSGPAVPEPSGDPLPSGEHPPEELQVALVKLLLSTVEHAVAATYKDLHV